MNKQRLLKSLKGEFSQEEFAARIGVSQAQVSRALATGTAGRKLIEGLIRGFPEQRDEIVAVFFGLEICETDCGYAQTEVAVEQGEGKR